MRKQILIITGILVFCGLSAVAQRNLQEMDPDKQAEKDKYKEENKPDWRERVSFGGNLTGGFSSMGSYFLIQPQVFYKIKPKTIVGTGVTYIYWSQKYINYATNQE